MGVEAPAEGANPGQKSEGANPGSAPTTSPDGSPSTTDWVAEARKWEDRARSNIKDAKRAQVLETKLKEYEDRDKTELQRATERADAAERASAASELRSLRLDVALRKGLPADMARRLTGESLKDLESDADALVELLKLPTAPIPDRDQGRGNGSAAAASGDLNSWFRGAAGRRPT